MHFLDKQNEFPGAKKKSRNDLKQVKWSTSVVSKDNLVLRVFYFDFFP